MGTLGTFGTRRAFLSAGLATVAAAALTACSAGQVAETALKNPSTYGVNTQNANGSVLVRGLAVTYNNSAGYAPGSAAPLELNLYNETKAPLTVLISSAPLAGAAEGRGVVAARSVELVGGEPSAAPSTIPETAGSRPAATPDTQTSDNVSPPPSAPIPSAEASTPGEATRPARIELGPLGSSVYQPGGDEKLQVSGLTGQLLPGTSVNLVFEFSDGSAPLVVQAPMSIPFSPASRGPAEPAEQEEHE